MEDASIDHILSIPWAKALIEDPKWKRARTPSRTPKSTGEDGFFATTLATDRTLRAFQTLLPALETQGKFVYHEVAAIITLGIGLDGFPQVCHGGMAATLLDEICGTFLVLSQDRQTELWKESGALGQPPRVNFMTAYLNTTYKRPIPAPSTILCTAKVERHDGRKLYMRATIEDGEGLVYTTGEAMFVEIKPRI